MRLSLSLSPHTHTHFLHASTHPHTHTSTLPDFSASSYNVVCDAAHEDDDAPPARHGGGYGRLLGIRGGRS